MVQIPVIPKREFKLVDIALGAAAGALGVWALDQIDWRLYEREPAKVKAETFVTRRGLDPAHTLVDKAESAMRLPRTGRPNYPNPTALGRAVHYAMGLTPAILYGAARRKAPWIAFGRGSAFGASLWLLQDELLNWATGLSAAPQRYHWRTHLRGLASHVAFGLTVDAALRLMDALGGARRAATP